MTKNPPSFVVNVFPYEHKQKRKLHYYSVKAQMDLGDIKVDLHEQVR